MAMTDSLFKQSLINLVKIGKIDEEKLYDLADNGSITDEELDEILMHLDFENV